MFKEQMSKIKRLFIKNSNEKEDMEETNEGKKDKRKIENLVFFLIVLIITVIAINAILNEEESDDDLNQSSMYKELAESTSESNTENVISSDELESKIEDILKTMEGVRRCKSTCYIFSN